jgi:hypothetical protein
MPYVRLNKGFGSLTYENVFLDQLVHDTLVFSRQTSPAHLSEQDILLFPVVRAIRIHADEVYRRIDKQRIDLSGRFDSRKNARDQGNHSLDQAMLNHERATCLHVSLRPLHCNQHITR